MESTEHTLPPLSDTFVPAPRRSIARRLSPVVAALSLLGGGGYGAYYYLSPSTDDDQADAQAQADGSSGSTGARESLKQLFTSGTSGSEDSTNSDDSSLAAAAAMPNDRYVYTPAAEDSALPELPPATDVGWQRDPAVAPAETVNPFAKADDRYAVPPTGSAPGQSDQQPTAEGGDNSVDQIADTPAVAPTDSETPEDVAVARGQDPEYNPLRTAAQQVATEDADARYGFANANAQGNAVPDASAQQPRPNGAYGNSSAQVETLNNPYAPAGNPTTPEYPAGGEFDQQFAGVRSAAESSAVPQAAPLPLSAAPRGQRIDSSQQANAARSNLPEYAGQEPAGATQPGHAGQVNPYAQQQYPGDAGLAPNQTPTPGINSIVGTGRPGERSLEGMQSPSIAIQKLAPSEIQVGKNCTFAIRVQNVGQRPAHGVRIMDEVPHGAELIGTAPRANASHDGRVEWDLGTLSPGEERIVEMELLPIEEGEIGSVATVTMAAQATARARCTKPELYLRLTAQPSVMIGQQHVIQVEVSNPGSGDATNVVLLENIPDGVTHPAGAALEYPIGTLRAGDTKRIELQLQAVKAGVVDNIMTARADANLLVEESCQFQVIAPELRVSVDGPKKRYLERPAKYVVNIANPGTAAAHDVQLVTQLPRGMEFVQANNLGEYDPSTHSVYWSLAELPAGEQGAAVELVATPVESGEHRIQVNSKARQGLEDHTEHSLMVEGLAALMFEVVDVQDPIEVGGETTYEIRVVNQGSKAATNVLVAAQLPRGMRAVSAQGETRHQLSSERVQFAPLPKLAPKAESTFRVTVQGTTPGDQRVRVMVKADEFAQPITKEASTTVYADE